MPDLKIYLLAFLGVAASVAILSAGVVFWLNRQKA